MRTDVTKRYRELCQELIEVSPLEASRISQQIEDLLFKLASKGNQIPTSLHPVFKTIIGIIKPFTAIIKFGRSVAGGKADLDEAAIELADAFSDLKNPDIDKFKDHKIYGALTFFNRIHSNRKDSQHLYHQLVRLFGKVNFTLEQLDFYLSGAFPYTPLEKQ